MNTTIEWGPWHALEMQRASHAGFLPWWQILTWPSDEYESLAIQHDGDPLTYPLPLWWEWA